MKFERRSSFGWGASAAGYAPCKNGLVAHYDGSNQGLAGKPHSACREYWKWCRTFHTRSTARGGRGWKDIGYSFAVCPHGYVMEGRGWQREQAAQPGGNTTWTSCTFMSGPSERPTSAQVNAFRELRAWLRGKGLAAAISYHGRFFDTSCPGAILRGMVNDGSLLGAPTMEDDMAITDDDARKIARAVWGEDGIIDAPPNKVAEGNTHWAAKSYTYWGYQQGTQILGLLTQLAKEAPDVDEDAVAAAILAGLTPERIAAAIPDTLAEQVVTALGNRLTPQEQS